MASVKGAKHWCGWKRLVLSRTRRTGLVALMLLFGSAASALALAHGNPMGMVQTGVLLLIGGGTLSALYLTWATYRDGQGAEQGLSLTGIADQLAVAVASQWGAEAAVRRLNDPYPLSVCWTAADPLLADDWSLLVTLASSGAGWPQPPPSGAWAAGSHALGGEGGDLVRLLRRVPTGRLVVLGAPGAGKTMLMIRLVLDLLARREDGGRVPILASLASWDPGEQGLREWLCAQMIIDNPGLAAAPPPGVTGGTRAEALFAAGLILPILDGLDEIPAAARGLAISRINDALRPGEHVVVTCRTWAYQAALDSSDGVAMTVRGAAVIQLCPLDAGAVVSYLRQDAGQAAAARWDPVTRALSVISPVGQALTTPLMADLARTIYNPRPHERIEAMRHPAELCVPAMADKAAVEQHLFDAFVPAAYRADAGRDHNRSACRAQMWLIFLARHLEYTIKGTDFAWWQLQLAISPAISGTGAGLGAGFALGLATGVSAGPVTGVAAGLASWLAVGLSVGSHTAKWRRRPEHRYETWWRSLICRLAPRPAVGVATGLAVGLAFGLSTGLSKGIVAGLNAGWLPGLAGMTAGLALDLAAVRWTQPEPARGMRFRLGLSSLATSVATGLAVGLATGLPYGVLDGLASGSMTGLAAGLAAGLGGMPPALTAAARPLTVLMRDRRAALSLALAVGLGLGVGVGFGYPLGYGLIIGSAYGLAFGLAVTVLRTAWPLYVLTRWWLALRFRLPFSLMSFLGDAHKRGVLRQAGAVYQFRHRDLQQRLASAPNPQASAWKFR